MDEYFTSKIQDYLLPKSKIDKFDLPLYQLSLEKDVDPQLSHLDFSLLQPNLIKESSATNIKLSKGEAYKFFNQSLQLDLKVDPFDLNKLYYQETSISSSTDATGLGSRNVGSNYTRGSTTQAPFIPGGFENNLLDVNESLNSNFDFVSSLEALVENTELLEIAPGLNRGVIDFDQEQVAPSVPVEEDVSSWLKDELGQAFLSTSLQTELGFDEDEILKATVLDSKVDPTTSTEDQTFDQLIPDQADLNLALVKPEPVPVEESWAYNVDINSIPSDYNTVVKDMARQFPFELDPFQKQAVYHLERGDSVFIAAHTSAGKTVVAEYAIAMANRHMTRAIYTSPIKALSNQKFRDFKKTFPDVGILTGDVQINPEGSCLIMTTEILRSMLYRGADIIRDVEFVIFDEVHYLNDAERGVVWEEVIILLPAHVSIILLSATVPNTFEFAQWIGRTKRKNIYVIATLYRPTPLEHHLYNDGELFKLVDAKRNFIETGWKALRNKLADREVDHFKVKPKLGAGPGGRPANEIFGRGRGGDRGRGGSPGGAGRGGSSSGKEKEMQHKPNKRGLVPTQHSGGKSNQERKDQTVLVKLVHFLKKKQLLPVIVFTFSKRRCDSAAATLTNVDLNTTSEKSQVKVMVNKVIKKLSDNDRSLPQLTTVKDWLIRGVAVHHSGLLPIVKEMVEILFARGLVKVLFATETFAMGVNMPARSVVFNGIKKHDGSSMRYLLPGEYTQMSGRAGRRGIDSVGMVMILCEEDRPPDMSTLKTVMLGKANKLASQFRLTYNMLLNLIRVESLKVEEMIMRSFAENISQSMLPQHQHKKQELEAKLLNSPSPQCEICDYDLQNFISANLEIRHFVNLLNETLTGSQIGKKVFGAGRVVIVDTPHLRNKLAIILKPTGKGAQSLISNNRGGSASSRGFVCMVLTEAFDSNTKLVATPSQPYNHLDKISTPTLTTESVNVSEITHITTEVVEIDSSQPMDRKLVQTSLVNLLDYWINSQIPILEEHLTKFKDLNFHETYHKYTTLVNQLPSFQCTACPQLLHHFALAIDRRTLEIRIQNLSTTLTGLNLDLMPEYHQRLQLLEALGFVTPNSGTLTLKGRVGCEINTVDALAVTELILANFFGKLSPEGSVALLSAFLFKEKTQSEIYLPPNLLEGSKIIEETVNSIYETSASYGLSTAVDDVSLQINFGLVEVVYQWASGMAFKSIMQITDVAEGSIVRTITRLDDCLRDVRNAARLLGDGELYQKMEQAQLLIQRDIVFVPSLYL